MSWKFTIPIVAETGAEDRFEINEYKAGKHMKSNYILNNHELKAVPPSLSSLAVHKLLRIFDNAEALV